MFEKRGPVHCGNCHNPGHTKRKCPQIINSAIATDIPANLPSLADATIIAPSHVPTTKEYAHLINIKKIDQVQGGLLREPKKMTESDHVT